VTRMAKRTRPRAVPGVAPALEVPQIAAHGFSVASVSLVVDNSRHSLACRVMRFGGACDCGCLRMSYDRLAELLAEGYHEAS
jgi:hypothetical protein